MPREEGEEVFSAMGLGWLEGCVITGALWRGGSEEWISGELWAFLPAIVSVPAAARQEALDDHTGTAETIHPEPPPTSTNPHRFLLTWKIKLGTNSSLSLSARLLRSVVAALYGRCLSCLNSEPICAVEECLKRQESSTGAKRKDAQIIVKEGQE
ncbi:hypothetical protein JZ751_015502 [Albula glossodonta]|uniref:Uncharacterized protein n=1 Tax=Albula glossodonta TaxID=121402 RepID=A0A8T2N1E7_9TELE|nr:hypothetical protein JZ751_015502 [Albula glossodonta]